ncbi:MAG: iron ABC transporter substrate-binding protein [Desulfobulbaceae bacterium A2]|nr:MAG: iron ABC transporter substrate-binding protein [Desulfobulbaceae bacterium A2]
MVRYLRIGLTLALWFLVASVAQARTITDAAGRQVEVPDQVSRVICSGAGSLRLLVYLGAQGLAVAVDDIETRRSDFDARPYALAHPELKDLPVFGEFRGHDNPERILALEPKPQVIFKSVATLGYEPAELQSKTGIPVVVVDPGDIGRRQAPFFASLRLMAGVIGAQARAEEVISFFEHHIKMLEDKTRDITDQQRPAVYLGGVAFRGPHGFRSTEPGYPPFAFVGARNLADGPTAASGPARQAEVAKEQIVAWNPAILFLDLSTLQLGEDAGGLHELKRDPAYRSLDAVKNGKVFCLLPYNWYAANHCSILANAYYVGALLYPDRFRDINPVTIADEIYTFLVGAPVFARMNSAFHGLAFQPAPLR